MYFNKTTELAKPMQPYETIQGSNSPFNFWAYPRVDENHQV